MQQIKMIGLDLDGTLLNTKKELTENTRRVLREAIDAGILVLMATGRPYTGIPAELRNFPGIHYALTSNGARVLDTDHNKLLIEQLLPRNSTRMPSRAKSHTKLFLRRFLCIWSAVDFFIMILHCLSYQNLRCNKKTGRIAFVSGAVNFHSSLEFTDRTQQTDHRCRRRNRRGW